MPFSPRWVIPALGLAIGLFSVGGVWFYTTQEQAIWHETEETLQAISNLQVERITRWRSDLLDEAAELTERPFLTDGIERWMEQPNQRLNDLITGLLQNLQKHDHYSDVLLLDATGNVRLNVSGTAGQLEEDAVHMVKMAVDERKPVLTDLHLNQDGTRPHLCAIAPLFKEEAGSTRPVGAIVLQTDARGFLYPLLQSWPTSSYSAETLLVRRDGDSVLFLNELRHKAKTALKMRIPLTQTDVPAVMAVLGKEGVVHGFDYRGVAVLSLLKPVPGTPWYMVAKIDTAEALIAWHTRSRLILGALLGIFLALVALAGFAWQQARKNHYKTLFNSEREARENEIRYRTLFDEATEGIALADAETGELLDFNQAFLELTEYDYTDLIGKPQRVLHPGKPGPSGLTKSFELLQKDTIDQVAREDLLTKNGTIKQVDIKANVLELHGRKVVQGFFRDVTADVRYHHEREITLRLLQLLNEPNNSHELIHNLTELLQEWTGCDAVGIRLRDGDDFPYYETQGFPASFVEAETFLCERDVSGNIKWDGEGNPLLECMCGNILRGRFNPSLPFFTPKGSFWTNCTTELLATTTEADRQARTRNRCNGEGYESVALIPLRHGNETLGLLQINNRSRGLFSRELLAFLENAADQIAIALSQRRAREALLDNEERFRTVADWTYDWELWSDPQGKLLYVSPSAERVSGYRTEEFYTDPDLLNRIVHPDDRALWEEHIKEHLGVGSKVHDLEVRIITKKGEIRWVQHLCRPVFDPTGKPLGWRASNRDITDHKLYEAERDRLVSAIEQAVEVVVITDAHGNIQYVNPAFEVITGYTRQEALGQNPRILKSGLHDASFYRDMWGTLTTGRVWEGTMINKRKDGSLYTEVASISPVRDSSGKIVNYVAVKRDITEQLHLQQEKESLQVQLLQSQKLEAVGRLAGGVAHDFNNMLQTILGYSSLALKDVNQESFLYDCIQEIQKAGQRSADLTRQLLAFARKQTASPKVLDLNDTVTGMLKMLQRLIGEDINLAWIPGHHLWSVHVDPSQIDQILANLAVNARDAIGGVGRIIIQTDNAVIDHTYTGDHMDAIPGEYVQLSVSDDGCGMDRETINQIFEPFFTTKRIGEGTGLGLATVYGIIRQNNGFINVYSEPGKGTTFRVYLPRYSVESSTPEAETERTVPQGGTETILFVEDEESVLVLGSRVLKELGYTVLTASTPKLAIQHAQEYDGEIHLLVTDVIMPEMHGKELSTRLLQIRPNLRLLYMSGYTADVIAHRGVLDDNVLFVQKPFTMETLAAKVRKALA